MPEHDPFRFSPSSAASRRTGDGTALPSRHDDDLQPDASLLDSFQPNPLSLDPADLGPAPSSRFMPIAEAAALFGRSPRTIRWWLAERRLPFITIGKAKFIPRAAIGRLMDGSGEESGTEAETGSSGSLKGRDAAVVGCNAGDAP